MSACEPCLMLRNHDYVWRILRLLWPESGIWVEDKDIYWWFLELLKAMYGLNDAPFAFQACQADFFVSVLQAIRNRFDENFMFWIKDPGVPYALPNFGRLSFIVIEIAGNCSA